MGCLNCVVRGIVDGKSIVVNLNINKLVKVDWNDHRNSMLYQCPNCKAYWEVGAYQPGVSELNAKDVEIFYPNASNRKIDTER
jgi:hypothetical protein